MTWLTAALLSTALFAVVSIMDKRLVEHLFPSFSAFNVAFGLIQGLVAPVFFIIAFTTVGFDGGSGIPWAIAAGIVWAIGLSLFFYGLSLEEVSRAAPMQAIAPIFVAVIAVTFLGDELSLVQWVAIVLVVVGAVMVSLRQENGRYRIAHGRAFLVLLASSFALGVAFVVTGEAVERMNMWAVQGFRAMFMGLGVLAVSWRPALNVELRKVLPDRRAMGLLFIAEGTMAPVAALLFAVGLSLGPVAVVSAVTSSRPLIILLLSTLLSTRIWNVLNEPLDRATLGLKAVSTALIVGAVITLAIQ
jgi:transporter family protein